MAQAFFLGIKLGVIGASAVGAALGIDGAVVRVATGFGDAVKDIAIVDFTFNLGAGRLQTSTLRRRINQRDWVAAGQELRRWV